MCNLGARQWQHVDTPLSGCLTVNEDSMCIRVTPALIGCLNVHTALNQFTWPYLSPICVTAITWKACNLPIYNKKLRAHVYACISELRVLGDMHAYSDVAFNFLAWQ